MRVALLLFFFLMSCGESPLFHHKYEKKNPLSSIFSVEQTPTFSKVKYQFRVNWDETPKLGANKFEVKFWDMSRGSDQGPFQDPPEELNIFLWMPAMGHGSVPVKISKHDMGDFRVSDVYFIMGGTWQIKFQLVKNDKVIDEVILSYHL